MKNVIKTQEVITVIVAIMIIIKVLVMIIVIEVTIEVMFYSLAFYNCEYTKLQCLKFSGHCLIYFK